MTLFSTFNQHSNVGSVRPNHLAFILTNNCVIILGNDKVLRFYHLCDPETTDSGTAPSGSLQSLCLQAVVSPSPLGFNCYFQIQVFREPQNQVTRDTLN